MSKPVYDSMAVEDFIQKYGKPYNPAADDYDRSPFIADIKEGKNDPIYNAHSYHTKVPPRAIIPYILHYTEPDDIVLDPFCGSGMTGVAAMLCENPPRDLLEMVQKMNPDRKIRPGARRAILNDISPAACHIAYNYCTPVDVEELKKEFERIKVALKDEFNWLYGTQHYEPAMDLYDPQKPDVAARLKNPPSPTVKEKQPKELFKGEPPEHTWELISREEVKRRMGPEALAKSPLAKEVQDFVRIPATIQYTIWSDVHRCEGMVNVPIAGTRKQRKAPRGCGREILLWDAAIDKVTGKVKKDFQCPHCSQEWRKRDIPRVNSIPVMSEYTYLGLQRTKKGVVLRQARATRPVTSKELEHVAEIKGRPMPYWVPDVSWDASHEMWRGGHRDAYVCSIADFYTPRNRWAVALIWASIEGCSERVRRALRFAFTGVCQGLTRRCRYLPGKTSFPMPIQTGTMYIPSFQKEYNGWLAFSNKLLLRISKLHSLLMPLRRSSPCVVVGSANTIGAPDNSIDYIFADPPFGSNIFYSDCSLIWEAWLGDLTNSEAEAVWNKSRKPEEGGKTLRDYAEIMGRCFSEMYRILKPGRCATVEFNNSDGRVFEVIKVAARYSGFEIVNMLFLDKDQKSFKQVKGAKGEENVVGHDVIFNLHKPGPSGKRARKHEVINGEFEHMIVESVREHLRGLPERTKKDPKTYSNDHRTTPFLNTMLMNTLIPKGIKVDRLNLPFIDALCSRYFRKIDNRWYLPDEPIGNGQEDGIMLPACNVEITNEVSAIEWLRQLLVKEPMMLGDIKPLWMRSTVMLTGDLATQLERILRQNFWLDSTTNKWREPTNVERKRMDTTERDRVLHNVERLLAGTLREIPGDSELCRWIGILYDTAKAIEDEQMTASGASTDVTPEAALELHRQIVALFYRVLAEKTVKKLYTTAARQARMARLKIQQAEEAKPKPPKTKTLFDILEGG